MKNVFISIILVFFALIGGLIWFHTQNKGFLSGLKPALLSPSTDITKVLEDSDNMVKKPNSGSNSPLKLPENFSISVFAKGLGKPRVIIDGPFDSLLVSIPNEGKVVALQDKDNNGKADEVINVVTGLNKPHGLIYDFIESPLNSPYGELLIAEADKISSYEFIKGFSGQSRYTKEEQSKWPDHNFVVDQGIKIVEYPEGGRHWSRTLLMKKSSAKDGSSDDEIFVSIGSSCDVCDEKDQERASILKLNKKEQSLNLYATGLRNSVFMTIHPKTGEIWATEMARDGLGDDLPPDEINIIREGKNYGWPICYGQNIHDTNFDENTYFRNPCVKPFEEPAHIDITPAHSSPLGLVFIPYNSKWPQEWWGDLLVSYHGSWNRSEPTGYKIVRYDLDEQGESQGVYDFISGWLTDDNRALGRPVGLLIRDDGSLYISDDKAGAIYKVQYLK